jgi:hypothetical protein
LLDADPFSRAASTALFDAGTGFLTKGTGYFFLKFAFMGLRPRPLLKGGEYSAFDAGTGFLTKGTGYFFLKFALMRFIPERT